MERLKTLEEILEYESEILDYYSDKELSRMGVNGAIMAVQGFAEENDFEISEEIKLDLVVDEINWSSLFMFM